MMRIDLRCSKGRWMNFLLLFLFFALSETAFAQADQRISGTVVDKDGLGVPGVNVTVKGTKKITSTSVTGAFNISAKQGDVLVFTAVSYSTKELAVTSQTSYKVVLNDENKALKEVVVVGYGTSSRKTLSSSVTTVKPEELNRGAIADVGQLLQGKVPGLNVSASGDPNKPAAVILRGASTVNSPGAPFYVIDGVPGADISAIAPNDIASIDVLKDAAATAIYGNRAASGVIMVTTKRGKKGQSQVTYSGYVSNEKVSNELDLMSADQLSAYVAANNASFSPNDSSGSNTNWMAAIQRSSAVAHNHNLSFSGGSEHSTYSASINYFKKDGILSKSSLERIIGRLNIDQYALKDKVKFSLNLSNSSSNSSYTPLQNIVLQQAAKHLPISPVMRNNGTYFENFNTTGYYNPVSLIDNAKDETKYNVLIGGFNTEVKLPFDLTYNVNLSYQRTTSLHGEFYNRYFSQYPTAGFYNNPDPGIGIQKTLIGNLFGTNGSALRNTFQNTNKTLETFLTWNKKFGDHSLTAVLGYSYQENVYGEGFQTSSTNFPADNIGYSNLSLGNPYAIPTYRINAGDDLTYGQIRMISDFARLNYNYKDKYLFQGSIRKDGSSAFGENNYWGYFPSVGLAWRISQEEFMKQLPVISELKLRASYGVTGNSQGIGAYNAKLLYGIYGTYYNNGVMEAAYGPTQGANPDLKWEKTTSKNLGFDFGIFNNKVTGTFDVYEKDTKGMLFRYNVSNALVPGGAIWSNGGSINNRGIEFSLSATPVASKKVNWSTSINLATNKNKITNLTSPFANGDSIVYTRPEGPGQSGSSLQILKVGYPIGQFYSLKYAGKDANGVSQFYNRDGSITSTPVSGTNYFYVGSPQPKLMMGWSNTVRYNNWDLNVFLRGTFGNKIFNATRADLSFVTAATSNNLLNSAADDKINDNKNSFYSDRYIEDGSYVRLDNATLGYNIKKSVKNVNNVRLYFSVNNLFTITKYSGIDPEINQGGAAPGIDYNNFYPKTRTFLLGANVSF
ncbi:SusC/RagA family TonB-linked outer membrane protein [Desertivirga brevis]|uniref:SusC/RagA family TonB-linked outer membrane protein n=1 Tax=Desertivirga brevis TaxID=2810310 RepID=UPI001F604530|nr:TonB-dependent receptor [Pedobacter sp. SYSU D00873]